jgi:redox-sensitive bicupin YhaK (pirin superfamily)
MEKIIKKIHNAEYSPIADLITYSPLPSSSLEQIDPFLFLNHHGPQKYKTNNNGLPFGPHPHRGMETVTFILDGDIMHTDSGGGKSIINAGGIQWMTAGRGLIHAEISSPEFKMNGGDLEILQLWLNLPARYKMTDPKYFGFQKDEIPYVLSEDGKVKVNIISGRWHDVTGVHDPFTDIHLYTIELKREGEFNITLSRERNVFFYVVKGKLKVNGEEAAARNLVEFSNEGEDIRITALEESYVILGHAIPFNEPIAAQGPFVMNTTDEIREAYADYRAGKFGNWEE